MVVQLEGDEEVRDSFLQAVPIRGGRRLVFQAPSQGRAALVAASTEVPCDFPRHAPEGTVPGVQPKLGVRLDGGTYTDSAESKRAERFQICKDLLDQVVAYAEHKLLVTPSVSIQSLVPQLLKQVQQKRFGWGLSPAEAGWLCARIKRHFAQ